jgi:hypothetical protein
MSAAITARVRASEPNVRQTWVNTTLLSTETRGSSESPEASARAFATIPFTSGVKPDHSSDRGGPHTGTPYPRLDISRARSYGTSSVVRASVARGPYS